MRYSIVTVRPSVAAPASRDDGLLIPLPGAGPDTVALEPRDGRGVRHVRASEVVVRAVGAATPILRADDVRAQVYVTDARVALACTKYDTGGGWIGGPIALTLNVASRVRAARRRRDRMLAGHVRYPWLRGVYARGARRPGGASLLRLVVETEHGVQELDLTLPRGADALTTATDVLRRAARFRLEHDEDATAAQCDELERLAALAPLTWSKGDPLAGHDLPTFWPPTSRSALLGLPEASRPGGWTAAPPPAPAPPPPAPPPPPPPLATLRRPASRVPRPPDDVSVVLRRPPAAADDDVEVTLRPARPPAGEDPRERER